MEQGAETDVANLKEQKAIDYSNVRGYNEITALILQYMPKDTVVSNAQNTTQTESVSNNEFALTEEEVMAKLKKLKSLFENELIDEQEYKAKKAKLIELF